VCGFFQQLARLGGFFSHTGAKETRSHEARTVSSSIKNKMVDFEFQISSRDGLMPEDLEYVNLSGETEFCVNSMLSCQFLLGKPAAARCKHGH
jgi:hypothetical protein